MKSSEILTNFVYKRRHNLFSELENGKIRRKLSLFPPSLFFFVNALPLLFPREPMEHDNVQVTLTLFRPGFFLLPATGRPSEAPLYNFRTAHYTVTKITHNA